MLNARVTWKRNAALQQPHRREMKRKKLKVAKCSKFASLNHLLLPPAWTEKRLTSKNISNLEARSISDGNLDISSIQTKRCSINFSPSHQWWVVNAWLYTFKMKFMLTQIIEDPKCVLGDKPGAGLGVATRPRVFALSPTSCPCTSTFPALFANCIMLARAIEAWNKFNRASSTFHEEHGDHDATMVTITEVLIFSWYSFEWRSQHIK